MNRNRAGASIGIPSDRWLISLVQNVRWKGGAAGSTRLQRLDLNQPRLPKARQYARTGTGTHLFSNRLCEPQPFG